MLQNSQVWLVVTWSADLSQGSCPGLCTNENSSIVRLLDASAKEERDKDVITRLWNADEIPMHHSGHEAGAKKKDRTECGPTIRTLRCAK